MAQYAAPTLAGIKPSNLLSLPNDRDEMARYIAACGRLVSHLGVSFEILRRTGDRLLVLIYRKDLLLKHLQSRKTKGLLRQCGYARFDSLDGLLAALRKRLAQSGGFPHEIGAFLGYATEDVISFIENKGQGCLLCGYWKVYHNKRKKLRIFGRYAACTRRFTQRFENGESIAQLLQTV